MELILIRHALPVRIERADGAPADPELSDIGHRQASALARWLQDEHIDRLYSSPLRRALQTAEPIADSHGLDIVVHEGVSEFDRDADFYVPLEELKHTDYAKWLSLVQGGWEFDPVAFTRTVSAALGEIIEGNRGRRVAVVCHGGVVNVWTAAMLGIDRPMFFPPEYTSVHRYRARDRETAMLVALNETAHLRDRESLY